MIILFMPFGGGEMIILRSFWVSTPQLRLQASADQRIDFDPAFQRSLKKESPVLALGDAFFCVVNFSNILD